MPIVKAERATGPSVNEAGQRASIAGVFNVKVGEWPVWRGSRTLDLMR